LQGVIELPGSRRGRRDKGASEQSDRNSVRTN
jgi:hypothetical protein